MAITTIGEDAVHGLSVLVAYDGSPEAELALELVESTAWPPESVVRVVTSPDGVLPSISAFATPAEAQTHAAQTRGALAAAHARITARLSRPGLGVNAGVLGARPGPAIVAEARRLRSDLVIVGSRGHGRVASVLLGSVSTHVSDRAHCSVLVVRRGSVRRTLLAVDASVTAAAAVDLVARWPLFSDARIRLVGVAPDPPGYPGVALSATELADAYRQSAVSAREAVTELLARVTARLRAAGRVVDAVAHTGETSSEVIAAAERWLPDVVVVPDHHRGPPRRLVLGGRARSVVHDVAASVLIVRPGNSADRETP